MASARSVSELLPRPFDGLTLEDVTEIIARVGDPKETLFFERKEQVGNVALAKSCAAFANTYGGLLLVGIGDKTDDLVGIPAVAEPQVWVKDVLRGNLLPLPAFQARSLELTHDPGRCVLLVLVPESSTTPHLLTTNGAIYVRNPGSADPVPIKDQARLLELTRRGIEARERAVRRARELISSFRFTPVTPYSLALAPTGYQTDGVRALYLDASLRERLDEAVIDHDRDGAHQHHVQVLRPSPEWRQHRVSLGREFHRSFRFDPANIVEGVVVESDCVVSLQLGYLPEEFGQDAEPRGPRPIDLERGVLPWFTDVLGRGRELILALGGHGDLLLRVVLEVQGRHVFYGSESAAEARKNFALERWVTPEQDSDTAERLADELRHEVTRFLGVGPS